MAVRQIGICRYLWRCDFFNVGLLCSREPLSRVESGAKPPGETQKSVSPGSPLASLALVERLQCGAALVAQDSSQFPLRRKEPFAKSPLGVLCGLSGSRTCWWERVRMSEVKPYIHQPGKSDISKRSNKYKNSLGRCSCRDCSCFMRTRDSPEAMQILIRPACPDGNACGTGSRTGWSRPGGSGRPP